MTEADLQHHIHLLLDGEISADEFAALEAELLKNPESLETYRDYARLHCGIQKHCDIQQLVKNPPVVPVDRVLALQRKSTIKTSVLGAAALVLLTAVLMWFFKTPNHQPSEAKFQNAAGSDFTLTHSGEGKAPIGNTMVEGSRLVLRHGVAELNLPHDVRAIVEAPAEMTLRDDRTLDVNYGRALFQVTTEDGQGFTVATPHQRIVDLGTAFGIDFQKGSQEIELHVLQGKVRVDGIDGKQGGIIQASRAVMLAGTRVKREIAPSPHGFLRHLPPKINMLVKEDFEHGLLADQNYIIRMDPTVIRDLKGNRFQGIDDDTTWNFNSTDAVTSRNAVILADDFSDVTKTGNTAAFRSWNHLNGIEAPATSLSFFKGDTTSALSFHNVTVGEIDVKNNMTAGGWDTSLVLDLDNSTVSIKLTSMVIDLRLTNNDGTPQATGKSSRVIAELVGSVSGLLGKVDPGNSPCPSGPYTRTLDLSSLPTLDGSESYTLHLKARGTGHGHNKSLQAIALKGDLAILCESSEATKPFGNFTPADLTETTGESDDSPPSFIALHPVNNSEEAIPSGQMKMLFNEPIKFGTGRVFIQNVSDWSESTLVVGSRQLSIDGRILTINPPTKLKDGSKNLGWLAAWESAAPVIFLNPSGDGTWYDLDDLQDDRPSLGMIGSMPNPGMVSINRTIRREFGTITAGSRYTVSTTIGVRTNDATFPGYTIRLSTGDTTLAKLTSNTPPGPANSVNTVGFSWDSSILPDGIHPGDPLVIEIIPASDSGYLDLNALRISAIGQSGK